MMLFVQHASTALHSGGDTMMAAVLNGEGELTTEKLRMPVPQYALSSHQPALGAATHQKGVVVKQTDCTQLQTSVPSEDVEKREVPFASYGIK